MLIIRFSDIHFLCLFQNYCVLVQGKDKVEWVLRVFCYFLFGFDFVSVFSSRNTSQLEMLNICLRMECGISEHQK